jgi:hypothetical protein
MLRAEWEKMLLMGVAEEEAVRRLLSSAQRHTLPPVEEAPVLTLRVAVPHSVRLADLAVKAIQVLVVAVEVVLEPQVLLVLKPLVPPMH